MNAIFPKIEYINLLPVSAQNFNTFISTSGRRNILYQCIISVSINISRITEPFLSSPAADHPHMYLHNVITTQKTNLLPAVPFTPPACSAWYVSGMDHPGSSCSATPIENHISTPGNSTFFAVLISYPYCWTETFLTPK